MLAEVRPLAANQTVVWSISAGDAATIDSEGVLRAISDGTVTVRATAADGSGAYGEMQVKISRQSVEVSIHWWWMGLIIPAAALAFLQIPLMIVGTKRNKK